MSAKSEQEQSSPEPQSDEQVAADDQAARSKRKQKSVEEPVDSPVVATADLIADAAQWLGCPSYVAAPALQDAGDELDVATAKSLVQKFLVRPVNQES